jgi:hypothetical protein
MATGATGAASAPGAGGQTAARRRTQGTRRAQFMEGLGRG